MGRLYTPWLFLHVNQLNMNAKHYEPKRPLLDQQGRGELPQYCMLAVSSTRWTMLLIRTLGAHVAVSCG